MNRFFKYFVAVFLILNFSISNSLSDDKFCIEDGGFVYPLFDQENCNNESDEKITKSEFINIINYEQNLRNAKLDEFRKNNPK